MFDIGFWELAIISIVALLIVGPEKLPHLVRDAGRWIRAARRFIAQTKRDLEREFDFEEEKDLFGSLRNMDNLLENAPDRKHRKRDAGSSQAAAGDNLYPEEDEYYASLEENASEGKAGENYINPVDGDDEPEPQHQPVENQDQDNHSETTSRRKPVDEDITS